MFIKLLLACLNFSNADNKLSVGSSHTFAFFCTSLFIKLLLACLSSVCKFGSNSCNCSVDSAHLFLRWLPAIANRFTRYYQKDYRQKRFRHLREWANTHSSMVLNNRATLVNLREEIAHPKPKYEDILNFATRLSLPQGYLISWCFILGFLIKLRTKSVWIAGELCSWRLHTHFYRYFRQ